MKRNNSQYHLNLNLKSKLYINRFELKAVVNEEILINSRTSANLNKDFNTYILTHTYITPLLDHAATIDHFLTYFHREETYIYKTIQFYISIRIILS